MLLFAGLGNPGEELSDTRHNAGRAVVMAVQKICNFPELKFDKKYNSLLLEGKIGKGKAVLIAPETFVNKSGSAVLPIAKYFKIKPDNIFIIHDDADLELGNTKMSFGKNSAGHKGVDSIIKSLKTKDFWRLRIGVGDRKDTPAGKMVLKKFTPKEKLLMKKVIKKTVEAIRQIAEDGPEKTMNFYNQN